MKRTFDIRPSNKSGINSAEHYIVISGNTVFLRILSCGSRYEVMTATVGEDRGGIRAYNDRKHILETAFKTAVRLAQKLSKEFGEYPSIWEDHNKIEYMKICIIDDFVTAVFVAETFFEVLDEPTSPEPENDLQEIYDAIAPDDSGGDVYMSDGMWLSKDGRVSDRGR